MIRDIANWRQNGTLSCPPDGQSDEVVFQISEDDLQEAESAHAKKRRSNFSARRRFMSRTSPSVSLAVIKVGYHTPDTSGFKLNDEGELELAPSANSVKACEQFIECCMHMLECQPRQHLLAVHIFRSTVTLISMDRVATTISIPFDYVKEPHKLLVFFYRLATSDRESLGYDPSMVPASQD